MYKHILIPTDGSPDSRAAIVSGVELAKAVGAKVTGFFAAPAATPMAYKGLIPVGYMTLDEHAALIEKIATAILEVIEAAAKAAGVACQCIHVTDDYPADAILAVAKKEKCDLIYMASHDRRGRSGLLIGGETQKVLSHSGIPVLVYR
ncbi:MAG: universal stress protein [Betaproteobacteria bacterium]|nr:universal stress protein [Betaproteobacteria bacterium]